MIKMPGEPAGDAEFPKNQTLSQGFARRWFVGEMLSRKTGGGRVKQGRDGEQCPCIHEGVMAVDPWGSLLGGSLGDGREPDSTLSLQGQRAG